MREDYRYSYGDWSTFHYSSSQRPTRDQAVIGIPNPVIKSNVGRIALIGYLDLDRPNDTWLIGFLPYEQASETIKNKSGETYWWIILSVASLDIARDLQMLDVRFEHFKHLPNVYKIDMRHIKMIFDWAEGANQLISSKVLYDEIESLQRKLLEKGNGSASKAYDKHLEQKDREILSLRDEIKGLRRELQGVNDEITDLTSKLNPKDTKGYVYLLKMVNGDYWKIGRTAKPKKRMDRFDVKLPFPVECEHMIQTENMYQLEHELHSKYADKRAGGEWFNLSQADIDYIKSL